MIKKNNPLELELLREMEKRGILAQAAQQQQVPADPFAGLNLVGGENPDAMAAAFLDMVPALDAAQGGEIGALLDRVNSNITPEQAAGASMIPEDVMLEATRAAANAAPVSEEELAAAVMGNPGGPVEPPPAPKSNARPTSGTPRRATPEPITEEIQVPEHPVPPMLREEDLEQAEERFPLGDFINAAAAQVSGGPEASADPRAFQLASAGPMDDAGAGGGPGVLAAPQTITPGPAEVSSSSGGEGEGSGGEGGFLNGILSGLAPRQGHDWGNALFDIGVGMLTSEGDTFKKIGHGLRNHQMMSRQRSQDARQARQDEQQSRFMNLRMKELEHKMNAGDVKHLGNGILWDFNAGQQVNPELVDLFNQQQERQLAAKAQYARQTAASSFAPGRYSSGYFYNEQQEPVFYRTNDRTGAVEYQMPDGTWTQDRPEGQLVRPEDSVAKHVSRVDGRRLQEISDAGSAARSTMGTINEMRRVLDENPDLYTGAGAGAFDSMRRWAGLLGAGDDTLNQVAAFDELRQLTMNLVENRIAATKGAISDREMAMFTEAVPNPRQSREGMLRGLDIMERTAQRQIEMDRFFAQRRHHMPVYQIEEAWESYINTHDAISDLIPEETLGTAQPSEPTNFENRTDDGVGFRIK